MEEKERCRSRSPARGTSRVQQVVGTIIRRTRESLSRYRYSKGQGSGKYARGQDIVIKAKIWFCCRFLSHVTPAYNKLLNPPGFNTSKLRSYVIVMYYGTIDESIEVLFLHFLFPATKYLRMWSDLILFYRMCHDAIIFKKYEK